jgi:hypothetical protein
VLCAQPASISATAVAQIAIARARAAGAAIGGCQSLRRKGSARARSGGRAIRCANLITRAAADDGVVWAQRALDVGSANSTGKSGNPYLVSGARVVGKCLGWLVLGRDLQRHAAQVLGDEHLCDRPRPVAHAARKKAMVYAVHVFGLQASRQCPRFGAVISEPLPVR